LVATLVTAAVAITGVRDRPFPRATAKQRQQKKKEIHHSKNQDRNQETQFPD
jgi:hypothetical protein